jgi:uncharacterized protein
MTRTAHKHPVKWAYFILALCLPSLYLVTTLKVDNRHDQLLSSTGPSAKAYSNFKESFGEDEFIVIALSGKPLFEIDALDTMLESMELLEGIPWVRRVSGIPAVFRDTFGAEDPGALEEEMLSTPFYRGLFLSQDGTAAGIMLELKGLDGPRNRALLVKAVTEAVVPLREYGFRVDIVGVPVFTSAINKASTRDSMIFFPIAAVASLMVLLFLLRSIRAAAVVLTCGGVTLLLTMAGVALLGWKLNLVTTSLPLVLWVLSIGNGIHLVSRFQRVLWVLPKHEDAIAETLSELRFACIFAAITTAMGFISLMVADVPAIRELGLYMAGGMLISLAVNLILGSYLLVQWHIEPIHASGHHMGNRILNIFSFTLNHPARVVSMFSLLVVTAVLGANQVETDSDALSFLPPDSEVVRSYDFVSQNLTGMSTMEIVVDTPEGWLTPAVWSAIDSISSELAKNDIVRRILTPTDFLRKMNQWNHDLDPEFYTLPDSTEDAQALLDLMEDEDRASIERFVRPDGRQVRLSVMVGGTNGNQSEDMIAQANRLIDELPSPLRATITGISERMDVMDTGLVKTLYRSYTVAFVLVFATILVCLRSVYFTLLSVLPNLMPVLSVLTVMAMLDIPLNAATAMVASISLGIAVDDTMHFLVGYRRLREQHESWREAVEDTLRTVGPSITTTTITACIGFFALMPSAFIPIGQFGMLCGIAILVALLSDLLLLPALIALGARRT